MRDQQYYPQYAKAQERPRGKYWIGGLLGLVALAVILGGWVASKYNVLQTKRENVRVRWSNIDSQLQRRADLIPNLVNTVKGYTKHEEQVFGEIAQARSRLLNPQATPDEKIAANGQMDGALSRLLVISENYPDLKANEQYKNLMTQLEGTENRIAVSRRDYNDKVADYNTSRGHFPGVIFANMFGFQPEQEFKVDPAKREAPTVDFRQ